MSGIRIGKEIEVVIEAVAGIGVLQGVRVCLSKNGGWQCREKDTALL